MAVNFIIQRATGGTINLQNKHIASLSRVTKGIQRIARSGEDIVNISVESAVKIPFHIGDKITVFGRVYKLNRLPVVKKEGKRLFTYDLEFEGIQYDLMRAAYDLTINTTNNELQDVQADTLTGNLWRFASVLIANANRVFPGKWVLGEFPADTGDKTLTFGEADNCLSVVQRICSEYNIDYDIEQDESVNRLHFRKSGQIFPHTFEYGKGNGLYSLERQNVSSANIVTRLKVFGSTRNILAGYRAQRLCLPGKTKGQSYIEKAAVLAQYGVWEATKYFDDIYPSRTGTITGIVSGSVLKFVDNTMNFDLNEKEGDGITTKYLLAGVKAKIHFNSGNLSGYEFELQSYDHATKTFTLKPFKDERGDIFPSEESAAFQFGVNDEYKILEIVLPQSYIDTAEAKLAAEGDEYYNQNSQPKVQYSLEVAEEFLKSLSGLGSTTNIFSVGDYIPVKDVDIDVDKSVRIQAFTRDLLNEYAYQLTISDTVTTSITNRVISELIDIDKVIKINNLKDSARAKRDWRSAQELLDMMFDVEGDYYSERIKPGSIETQMLSVGAKSTQLGLIGTVIQANYNGNKNLVNVKGGVLSHYTIEENGRIWNLADNQTTLTGDSTPYYLYAKCQRVGTAGSIIFSTAQISVEQDPAFYHFFVGVVNSVDPGLNVRSVALTYGFTTVNGRFVRTGRIQSNDGATYFDLDTGTIGGRIKFLSSGNETDLEDWSGNISGDIQYSQQAASDADQKAQQAINDAAANVEDYNTKIAEVQKQIDGEVSNWFYAYSPTLSNYPASEWNTTELKDRHIGDTFTNTEVYPAADAGKSWRFIKNGAVYSWTLIADSDAIKALQQAAQAQATADGKSTTFLVQPTKYHLGDTWVLNADRTINGTPYKQGEILTAAQDSTSFVEAHWIKRVRYTDDTAVDNLKIGAVNLIAKKYIRDWNVINSVITLPGSDADGDYLAIDQGYLYGWVGGGESWNDIFQRKIKYKPNTQYALKVRWKMAGVMDSVGLLLRFNYSDGSYGDWGSISGVQTTITEHSAISEKGKTVTGISTTYGSNVYRSMIYDIQLTEGNKQTAGFIVAEEDKEFGTVNLVRNSDTRLESGQYHIDTVDLSEDITDGTQLTFTAWGELAAGQRVYVGLYPSTANLWYAEKQADGTYRGTFTFQKNPNYSGDVRNKLMLYNDPYGSNLGGYLAKYKLEKGDKSTDWSPNPKDIVEKVDNIKIGGRNLSLNSKTPFFGFYSGETGTSRKLLGSEGTGYGDVWYIRNNNTGTSGIKAIRVLSTPDTGEIVTVSFKTRSFMSNPVIFASNQGAMVTTITNDGQMHVVKWEGIVGDNYGSVQVQVRCDGEFELYIWDLMYEHGNKATDWSPAPEDVAQDATDKANSALQEANNYTINQLKRTEATVDARSLDPNVYYPVVIQMTAAIPYRIKLYRTLSGATDGIPPWSSHAGGFSVNCEWTSIGSGWGTIPVRRFIERFDYGFADGTPVGSIGQMQNASYEYIYVRGGSRYHFIIEGGTGVEVSLKTEIFTALYQTIGPMPLVVAPVIDLDAVNTVAADALAKANLSKAITDKFGTTVDGGLIGAVMIVLRELNSMQETAGISGIQGALRNNPAFWAGGTYAQASALLQFLSKMSEGTTPSTGEYAGLAKITMLHNGAAKVGDFIIEETGRIIMVDPATGKPRLMFGVQNIPLIADLMSETQSGGSSNIGPGLVSLTTGADWMVLSGNINVGKSNSTITFGGCTLSIEASSIAVASATATLQLFRNGSPYIQLGSVAVQMGGSGRIEDETDSVRISRWALGGFPEGIYTVRLAISGTSGLLNASASCTISTLTWAFVRQDVRFQQYGLDGFMQFFADRHLYYTESRGLDVRGPVNMPGTLASGRVTAGGSISKYWKGKGGSITSNKNSTGMYTVNHGITGTDYIPVATVNGGDCTINISGIYSGYFTVAIYHISPVRLLDCAFSFVITGNNY